MERPLEPAAFLQSVTFDMRRGLSLEAIAASIRNQGLCILKSVLAPDGALEIHDRFNGWYESAKDDNGDGKNDRVLQSALTLPNFPGLADRFIAFLAASRFPDIGRHYFSCATGNLVIPENHVLLRVLSDYTHSLLVRRSSRRHNFHLDYPLIPHSFPMNVWIPLTKIDQDCRGLSFLLPYTESIYDLPLDIDGIMAATNGYVVTPEAEVGDMFLFTHKTLHGVFFTPEKTRPRLSIEFRVGPADMLPADYRDVLYRL